MEGRGLKLLFIKLKHIGDSLLLTPTLIGARQQYPDAEIWVVVRKSCERILAGCSSIDQLRTVAAPESIERSSFNWLDDWKLVREIRRKKFDYVFELSDGDRGRWMATLSGARLKCANARGLHWWWRRQFKCVSHYQWLRRHWVEKDYYTVHDCLSLPATVPGLSFEKKRAEAWPRSRRIERVCRVAPWHPLEEKRMAIRKLDRVGEAAAQPISAITSVGGPMKKRSKWRRRSKSP